MSRFLSGFVAVLDSGIGGLTVLADLLARHPQCNFAYIADEAYCPYGTKQPREILARVQHILEYLSRQNVAAVVLACNTASIFADELRKRFDMPIYDVIEPTCRLIAQTTVTKRVALLATNATVNSGSYSKRLADMGISTISFACSDFVPFAEKGGDSSECRRVVKKALEQLPFAEVDTVALGCTHFPLLKNNIAPYCGNAKMVECVTDFVPPALNSQLGKRIFFTTGEPFVSKNALQMFYKANFLHINI